MADEIAFSINDGVARITLNRPHIMNALTFTMWGQLHEMIQEIEHDPDVRCVVLAGAGQNFCSGHDVSEFAELAALTPRQMTVRVKRELDKTNLLFLAMERIPQPVVLSVQGVAAGGGLSLVAAADLIVASDTARFHAAQIRLGAVPDLSLAFNLRRAIGIKKAKQYCLLGDVIDAKTALELGLVNWVVPSEALEQETNSIVKRLVGMAPVAIARTKSTLNRSFGNTLAQNAAEEPYDIGLCNMAPEFADNIRAFTSRRRAK